jgi:hypothetical protein
MSTESTGKTDRRRWRRIQTPCGSKTASGSRRGCGGADRPAWVALTTTPWAASLPSPVRAPGSSPRPPAASPPPAGSLLRADHEDDVGGPEAWILGRPYGPAGLRRQRRAAGLARTQLEPAVFRRDSSSLYAHVLLGRCSLVQRVSALPHRYRSQHAFSLMRTGTVAANRLFIRNSAASCAPSRIRSCAHGSGGRVRRSSRT